MKMALDGRQPLKQTYTTSKGRPPSVENDLKWKTTKNEDNLPW